MKFTLKCHKFKGPVTTEMDEILWLKLNWAGSAWVHFGCFTPNDMQVEVIVDSKYFVQTSIPVGHLMLAVRRTVGNYCVQNNH